MTVEAEGVEVWWIPSGKHSVLWSTREFVDGDAGGERHRTIIPVDVWVAYKESDDDFVIDDYILEHR